MKKIILCLVLSVSFGTFAIAEDGLVINAAEMGVGKFHRYDNKVKPYGENNAWSVFILPSDRSTQGMEHPVITDNSDGSKTIYFAHLEELLTEMVKIVNETGKKIKVFNLHAHGLPGGMWFPKDKAALNSWSCYSWVDAASSSDAGNYQQYYSAVSKDQIMSIRQMSESIDGSYSCVVGLKEWKDVVRRVPDIKKAFTPDAQLHALSCVVGLGRAGAYYTKGLAKLLFNKESPGSIQTAYKFGLGDWSMREGMGFWDYLNDEQHQNDEAQYPSAKEDRLFMQSGNIRVVSIDSSGEMLFGMIKDVDFMLTSHDNREITPIADDAKDSVIDLMRFSRMLALPKEVQIPGTNIKVYRE